jgi:ParB family chromosome partitioning protein
MNETLRRLKESGAVSGTGTAITEELNDPGGLFESMFTPGPSKLAPPGSHGAKEISLDLIDPWRDAEHESQPFKPYPADKLQELAENIRQNGVISPVRLRPSPFEKGRYQILAGHNRVAASKMAGRKTVPAILMQATDDEAKLVMIDSNLYQRDHLLPSERAWAYKMRFDTIRRKAGRPSQNNSVQVAPNLSTEQIGEESGISKDQVKRYIRLTYLLPPLLEMVDAETVPFTAGVSVSFLPSEAQQRLLKVMETNGIKRVTRSQGEELKAFRDRLNEETILRIFGKSPKTPTVKPQSIRLQVDYSPAIIKRLAKDEVLQARIRALIDAYVKENLK